MKMKLIFFLTTSLLLFCTVKAPQAPPSPRGARNRPSSPRDGGSEPSSPRGDGSEQSSKRTRSEPSSPRGAKSEPGSSPRARSESPSPRLKDQHLPPHQRNGQHPSPVLPSDLAPNDYVSKIVHDDELEEIINYLVDFGHLNGLVFIDPDHQLQTDPDNLSNHFSKTEPMTVFPSPFPAEFYDMAWELQPLMAQVHLRVSLNPDFIEKAMESVARADKFIARMLHILKTVKHDRKKLGSGMTLILQRSDYMTHMRDEMEKDEKEELSLKQIEVSTGIGKGAGDGPLLSLAHERVLGKLKYTREGDGEKIPDWFQGLNVTKNGAIQGQAKALFQAWLRFSQKHKAPDAVILLISAPKRRHYSHYEQLHWAMYELENVARAEVGNHRPEVVQITIKECMHKLELEPNSHHLILNGHMPDEHNPEGHKRRVAVAIFLDGYLAEHFPKAEGESAEEAGNKAWAMRLSMEQSTAVLSPNVFVFMCSTKKIQQVLSEPDQLERFFPEAHSDTKLAKELKRLRSTFIKQWGLGNGHTPAERAEEEKLVKEALAHPEDFVLKENQQSGKGIYIGDELKVELAKHDHKARAAFILQKLIRPVPVKNASVPIPEVKKDTKDKDAKKEHQVGEEAKKKEDDAPEASDIGRGKAKEGEEAKKEAPAPVKIEIVDMNSELSIFGSLLTQTNDAKGQEVIVDTVDGYMVRSKMTKNGKCNVSSGNGGMDSLALFSLRDFKAHLHRYQHHQHQKSEASGSNINKADEGKLVPDQMNIEGIGADAVAG